MGIAALTFAPARGEGADEAASPARTETIAPRPADRDWREDQVEALAIALFDAPSHGLPALDSTAERLLDRSVSLAGRGELASHAFRRYAGWLRFGLIDSETRQPVRLDADESFEIEVALDRALSGEGIAPVLDDLLPTVPDYRILQAEMLRLMALHPIWPQIEDGPSLVEGEQGRRVDQLRARLSAVGLYNEVWRPGEAFDARLATALVRFQGQANLSPSGELDRPTLRQLNITPQARMDQLRLNLEQRRWQERDPGHRYIRVNLADFQLEAWEGGRIAQRHDVMVGRQVSSTPEFTEEMQYLVLNPWWGLPSGLATGRFQSFRRNPGLARQLGFRIYDASGQQISVYDIDWSRWGRGWPYRLSQPPGGDNPMGEVKFIFPNSHNVYLHDTNHREQFTSTRRDFSAACVRVRDPLRLAAWVLQYQDGWDAAEIDRVTAGNTPTVVWLDERIPVHINYWTAVGDPDGRVRYLYDLYSRDGALIRALAATLQAEAEAGLPVMASRAGGAAPTH
tara:strand:- start:41481 stop:43016 length:1536 start_codon:yes stop_codon:yes gene_type:complete